MEAFQNLLPLPMKKSIAENELGEYSLCNASVEWCGEITYERTVAKVVPCNTEITEDESGEVAIIKKTTEHFLFHRNMNNFIVHFWNNDTILYFNFLVQYNKFVNSSSIHVESVKYKKSWRHNWLHLSGLNVFTRKDIFHIRIELFMFFFSRRLTTPIRRLLKK